MIETQTLPRAYHCSPRQESRPASCEVDFQNDVRHIGSFFPNSELQKVGL
jgi:hypothetical protein